MVYCQYIVAKMRLPPGRLQRPRPPAGKVWVTSFGQLTLEMNPPLNILATDLRRRSMANKSLDGDTVDGSTVLGRDPAFIQQR